MKLSDLIAKYDAFVKDMTPDAVDRMHDALAQIIDQHAPAKCDMCKGTGIATVVTSPPHIKPVKTKEIQCPNGCNAQAVRDAIQTSRDIMMMESAPIFEAARNPDMPPGWKDWKREGQ